MLNVLSVLNFASSEVRLHLFGYRTQFNSILSECDLRNVTSEGKEGGGGRTDRQTDASREIKSRTERAAEETVLINACENNAAATSR